MGTSQAGCCLAVCACSKPRVAFPKRLTWYALVMCSCLCEVVGMPPMGACCPLGSPCHSLFQISLGSGCWQRTQLVTAGLTKLRSYLGFVNLGWRDRDHISVSSAQSGLARSRLQSRFRQLRVVAEAPIGQGQTQHLHVCVCVCVSASGGSRQCEGPQASTPLVLHKGIYESEVSLITLCALLLPGRGPQKMRLRKPSCRYTPYYC